MANQAQDNIASISRRAAIRCGLIALLMSGASAAQILVGTLSGAAEDPPNASPATGTAVVTYNATTHQLTVFASFAGLQGTSTLAHIHCCTESPNNLTAGVATQTPSFSGFPAGVSSGTYANTFDLTLDASFNASFITANGGTAATAEAALVNGMLSNRSYFNLHTTSFPGGEIRAFLTPVTTCSADFDGNGQIDALTDGLLFIRAAFGLTGTAVTNGALGVGATRDDWTKVRDFMNANCGTSFAL